MMFGVHVFADVTFAEANQVGKQQGNWIEICPTDVIWPEIAKAAYVATSQPIQATVWDKLDKDIRGTKKCR